MYVLTVICATAGVETKIEPLNYCSLGAARIKRSDFDVCSLYTYIYTTTNNQQPTNNKQQTTNNKQQTTNNKHTPTMNNQQPTTNKQHTTTDNQQPTNNKQQPTTNKQQTANNKHDVYGDIRVHTGAYGCIRMRDGCI